MWNQGQRCYKIEHPSSRRCIFLYHTIETSVTWHSYVVHVWNFLNFLQKVRRPKSSDCFPIRILCKHSLPCPRDPISTEQKDWLLRSQKWTTSVFFSQFQYMIKRTGFENYENDHQREYALIFHQILSTSSLKTCKEISVQNSFLDTRA